MSFVYVEKRRRITGEHPFTETSVYSDTKITLTGAVSGNWCEKQAKFIQQYGMSKSIIIGPQCCISFAGNNLILANQLIKEIYTRGDAELADIVAMAYSIHSKADQDDIEFIICFADEDDTTHIACIKEGKVQEDCQHAWIGSYAAFRKLEELYFAAVENAKKNHLPVESIRRDLYFTDAIHSCGDDSVGGFTIPVSYIEREHQFVYSERLYSRIERPITLQAGECLPIVDTIERGGFTIHSLKSPTDAYLQIEQINRTIMYTNHIRLTESDLQNERYRFMMLPILCDSSTGRIV